MVQCHHRSMLEIVIRIVLLVHKKVIYSGLMCLKKTGKWNTCFTIFQNVIVEASCYAQIYVGTYQPSMHYSQWRFSYLLTYLLWVMWCMSSDWRMSFINCSHGCRFIDCLWPVVVTVVVVVVVVVTVGEWVLWVGWRCIKASSSTSTVCGQ